MTFWAKRRILTALVAVAPLLAMSPFTATPACAEAAFAFATTPGKLPKTVVPTRYALDLDPDLDALEIKGSVAADIEVAQATDRITLNAVNMSGLTANIDRGAMNADDITLDARAETATLHFPQSIDPGHHVLVITFTAKINKFARGLFVVDYPTDAGRKRMISSQLEPADARRIFPSWDEPAFKASFDLAVTVPENFLAVSNMPIRSEMTVGGGRKRVDFETTPKMSTYLFVLAAGELERITGEADGVSVGVVATRGKGEQGRYALETAVSLLEFYDEYFGVKFPLPKLDLVAVPGGFGGAMENWGGITFFESRLLFDPKVTSPTARRGIFVIIAHEMAHQWFGDLVTTAWWDNLWLNEGFASWMQEKAADHFHPDWHVWLNSSEAKQSAMNQDARRTSHPIQQPIADESEAMSAFDGITYIKGQAFIRMLEDFLGEAAFRAGIRGYMQAHAYGSATTADLWQALADASGRPVAAVASAFTEQAGVPLVSVTLSCTNRVASGDLLLSQERFTIHDPAASPLHWLVPVTYGRLRAASANVLLDGKAKIYIGPCFGAPVKLNLGDIGYYRVAYDPATRAALAKSIRQMLPADRVNFLADTWAQVEAGHLAPADFLKLIDVVDPADNRVVWDEVTSVLTRLDRLEQGRAGRSSFQAYARAKLRPVLDRLGWEPIANEPDDTELLRTRLIRLLGDFGDEPVLSEARRRFAAFLQEPASLRTGLREVVTHLAGRTADRSMYETLHRLARETTSTDERVRYYSALAAALDPNLARETLSIALTDDVSTTIVGTLIFGVAADHRELAWSFVKDNFAALASRQGPSFRDNYPAGLLGGFADQAHAAELAAFAPAHATAGGRIVAARAEDGILADADFSAKVLPQVDDWARHFQARP